MDGVFGGREMGRSRCICGSLKNPGQERHKGSKLAVTYIEYVSGWHRCVLGVVLVAVIDSGRSFGPVRKGPQVNHDRRWHAERGKIMTNRGSTFWMGCGVLAALLALGHQQGAWAQGSPDIVWQVSGTYAVDDVAYSSGGAIVASAARDEVILREAENGNLLDTFAGHEEALISVDLSPDGEFVGAGYIVSGYPPSGEMKQWQISPPVLWFDFPGCFVAFSPDGELVASGGGGPLRYLFLHYTATGQELWYAYTGTYITDVAYSPDGGIIGTGGTDNNIQLWDAATGTLVRTLSGHTDDVSCIAFSPDGAMLVSGAGGWDEPGESTIKLWRVSDGMLLRTLDGHGYWVDDLAYSPDGLYVVSSGRDGLTPIGAKIKFWRVSDGELMLYYDEQVSTGVAGIDYSPGGEYFLYGRSDAELVLAHNPLLMPDVSIELSPYNPPIVIPAWGGSFDFNALITNNETSQLSFNAWVMVTLPNGSPYGPVQGPVNVTLPGGGFVSRDRTQGVPAFAPPGTYTYTAFVGTYPDEAWGSDSFEFSKLNTR